MPSQSHPNSDRLIEVVTSLGKLIDQITDHNEELTRQRHHADMLLATVISHVLDDLHKANLEEAIEKLTKLHTLYRSRADR